MGDEIRRVELSSLPPDPAKLAGLDLKSVQLRSGESVQMAGHGMPAGDLFCSPYRVPACFPATDIVSVDVRGPIQLSLREGAVISVFSVLATVAATPLMAIDLATHENERYQWWRDPEHDCAYTLREGTPPRSETQAIEQLESGRQRLTSACLRRMVSGTGFRLATRANHMLAVARTRFEAKACHDQIDIEHEPGSPLYWVMPDDRNMMRDPGMISWPQEARAILNDPATYQYEGLAIACADRGGVAADLSAAIRYAKAGWPLPTPL